MSLQRKNRFGEPPHTPGPDPGTPARLAMNVEQRGCARELRKAERWIRRAVGELREGARGECMDSIKVAKGALETALQELSA